MIDRPAAIAAIRTQLQRQVAHWAAAAARLELDDLASPEAWKRLEQYLGVALRNHLGAVITRLRQEASVLVAMERAATSATAMAELRRRLLAFRRQYSRAEYTLDYFADAINTRTSPRMAALLRACDILAHRSMALLLDPLGKETPPVITYVDRGLGASILKAGLRLWDGGDASPVAAIKVTRHNLLRPTALIHEAGHQVAHITSWNQELATILGSTLSGAPGDIAATWSSWSSEIAADAFAFVHTGYASVAALHDVIAGDADAVFRHSPGDPHPIPFLRVLLGVEMCRHVFGRGPWDGLAEAWKLLNPLDSCAGAERQLLEDSIALLPRITAAILDNALVAFGGQPLRHWIPPERVSPQALEELERRVGPALFTSAHWLWNEPLRILGLTGLVLATARTPENRSTQERAMLRLGGLHEAA